MESCSLQSATITTIPSSLSRSGFIEKPLGFARLLNLPISKRYPNVRKLKSFDFKAQASGTTKISLGVTGTISNKADSKDEDLAFVAGATGKVGSRTVRELLKLGFRVRAGVRSAQKAETLVQSVKQMKLDPEGTTPIEKLEIVEVDLEKQDTIGPAIANASVVICCIGASEKEVLDITGPYRIDYQATKNLIDAATVAKVNHFLLVTSLGTNKVGFPAAILNLFWGVLIWKRKAEEALIASGLPYTIVRPGGMERPTDAFKETHNITLSTEDTLFGGLVSNLQVAELLACMAKNRSLSYCKVVEVVAETTAPLKPMEELLAKIPSQRADISPPKVSDTPTKPDSASVKSIVAEEPTTPSEEEPAQEKAVEPTTPSKEEPAQEKAVEPTTPSKEEPAQEKVVEPKPLSPFAAYDDLKPPTSPSPTPSGSKEKAVEPTTPSEEEPAQEKAVEPKPLSPFAAYDDLKPPTSPSPTPSGSKEVSDSAFAPVESIVTSTQGNSAAPTAVATDIGEKDLAKQSTCHSPFYAYPDLKPPSSPTPSAPKTALADSGSEGATLADSGSEGATLADSGSEGATLADSGSEGATLADSGSEGATLADSGSEGATLSVISTDQSPVADKPSDEQLNTKPKTRPLSPFAMYADLKPPASPYPRAPTAAPADSGSQGATLTGNSTAQSSIADKPSDEQHNTKPTPRPLSPFAMYEDLKPPTSPIPSSPRKS